MGQNIGNYLNVELLSVPVTENFFWTVCLLAFAFSEPAHEVEKGEQDETGWTGHGRVARVELRRKPILGDPKMRELHCDGMELGRKVRMGLYVGPV